MRGALIPLKTGAAMAMGTAGPAPYVWQNAEAESYAARMTVQPNDTRKGVIDTLVGTLKAAGVWAKLDSLYLIAAHDAQTARLNAIADAFNLVTEGTPTFTVDRGYANDVSLLSGGADALSIGVGALGLTKFITNSASLGAWVRTATINQQSIISNGLSSGSQINLWPRNSSGIIAGRLMSSAAFAGSAASTGYGLTAANRSASNAVEVYKNGAAAGSGTAASITRTSDTLKLSGEHQYQAAFFGQSLTAQEHADLHAALAAYMTAVGVAELAPAAQTWVSEATGLFPDGDAPYIATKGANILGMVRDPVDGSWWGARGVGSGSMTQAGVIHLNRDETTGDPTVLIDDWTLTEINATDTGGTITDLAAGSCQGITVDTTDQSIYVINKVANQLFRIDKNGALLSVFPIGSAANGIAYDAIRDKLIILFSSGDIVWYNKNGTAMSGSSKAIRCTSGDYGDQLYHDPVNDWLYVSRDGSTSTDSHCHIWRLSDPQHPTPYKAVDATLSNARAIEGLMPHNGKLWIACDGSFHGGNTGTGVRNDNHWRRHAIS